MATLRDYIANDRKVLLEKYKQQQLAIYNTNIAAVTNGGQLCTWTVPPEITWSTFELWGAGGDGGGACCCAGNYMGGGSGNYAKKTVTVVAGTTFTICAAGSGCCSQPLAGTCGLSSYVRCGGGAGAIATCASGGSAGTATCGHMGGMSCTGICVPSCVFGCNSAPADMALPSVSGADRQSNYCVNMSIAWAMGAPKYQNNSRMSSDFCVIGMASVGCSRFAGGQASLWPGGGGVGGAACAGGCCWASWGAGGLVLVTYG